MHIIPREGHPLDVHHKSFSCCLKRLAQRQVAEVLFMCAVSVCDVMSHLATCVQQGQTSSLRVVQKVLWTRL